MCQNMTTTHGLQKAKGTLKGEGVADTFWQHTPKKRSHEWSIKYWEERFLPARQSNGGWW